jgi:hypothetical protein
MCLLWSELGEINLRCASSGPGDGTVQPLHFLIRRHEDEDPKPLTDQAIHNVQQT